MNLNHNRKKETIQQAHMSKMEMNLISLVKISVIEIKDRKRQWGGAMNLNHNRKKETIQQAHMSKMEMNLISLVKISVIEIKDRKRQW
ncbi:hypothetical protein F2Q70_00021382 [Brassica cretica]|uniref:Uncharacterized protein n=1 Tax=Brassica cretica TaxID=69181 RepID=A0A8S9GIL2_BRACR|nr:hypothetical protein F2Q70_00021382 [Brassica cretica]